MTLHRHNPDGLHGQSERKSRHIVDGVAAAAVTDPEEDMEAEKSEAELEAHQLRDAADRVCNGVPQGREGSSSSRNC